MREVSVVENGDVKGWDLVLKKLKGILLKYCKDWGKFANFPDKYTNTYFTFRLTIADCPYIKAS